MKKLVMMGMCALMAVGVLAGCSTETESDNNTLTIAGLEGGYGKEGWEAVVAEFEKEYDVKVELTLSKTIE